MARGSLYETRHWLRRAHKRNLLNEANTGVLSGLISELTPKLNAYIRKVDETARQKPEAAEATQTRCSRASGQQTPNRCVAVAGSVRQLCKSPNLSPHCSLLMSTSNLCRTYCTDCFRVPRARQQAVRPLILVSNLLRMSFVLII